MLDYHESKTVLTFNDSHEFKVENVLRPHIEEEAGERGWSPRFFPIIIRHLIFLEIIDQISVH